jgi:hypothetical protein
MRFPLFFVAGLFAFTAQGGQQPWPASSPADRAIFCGEPATETSLAYSTALNAALNELTAKGATVQEAMDSLKARARCGAGRQRPVPATVATGVPK